MNKTIFYLATCSTCQRIMKQLGVNDSWKMREIKSEPMSEEEVDQMRAMSGSYEAIFSRRSMKYRAWNLKDKELTEQDYRDYILKEYTFLKRPVIIIDEHIFIGNTKKVIEEALLHIQ